MYIRFLVLDYDFNTKSINFFILKNDKKPNILSVQKI